MHQESQKISVPYNGILPINIKQVPQYSPIPVDTLVECHVRKKKGLVRLYLLLQPSRGTLVN